MEEKDYDLSEEAQDILDSIQVDVDIEDLIEKKLAESLNVKKAPNNSMIGEEDIRNLVQEQEYSGIQATWQDFKGWIDGERAKETETLER